MGKKLIKKTIKNWKKAYFRQNNKKKILHRWKQRLEHEKHMGKNNSAKDNSKLTFLEGYL